MHTFCTNIISGLMSSLCQMNTQNTENATFLTMSEQDRASNGCNGQIDTVR